MEISVKADVQTALNHLDQRFKRQVPYAVKNALNAVAGKVKEAEVREIRDVFDRPTPYTLNGLYIQFASAGRLRARVQLKSEAGKGTPVAKYLAPQIKGGARRVKRFEKALRAARVLPEGMYAMPGEGADMDAYGNIKPSQIVQILSFFKAFPEAGYRANMNDKSRARLKKGTKAKQGYEYFVGRPGDGKLPLGVWKRIGFAAGTAIKPVLIFVDGAQYEKLLDFKYVAELAIQKHWKPEFLKALSDAVRTAR